MGVWKSLAVIFLAVGCIGVFTPKTYFINDYQYAFYAGPKVEVSNSQTQLSTCTSLDTATSWFSHIHSETLGLDIFTEGEAAYNLSNTGDIVLKAHDYNVHAPPPSMVDGLDVRNSMYSKFFFLRIEAYRL